MSTDYIQKYEGPPAPVDVILVGHVMYYVIDEFLSVVEKLLKSLTPGGCLVLSHVDPVAFHYETGEMIYSLYSFKVLGENRIYV